MTTNRDLFAKHVALGTFIETGTAFGRSVQTALELGFKDVRSVEGSKDRYDDCRRKFAHDSRVFLWHGESVDCLPRMLPETPVLLWLDAHPSGEGSFGQDYESNPAHTQSSVLREELTLIYERNVKGDVILIDDLTQDIRDFALKLFRGSKIQVYSTDEGVNKVMEIVT